MNGHEFQRRLTRLGRKNGIQVIFEAGKGKGSHGTICYGAASTTLKDRRKEISPGLLRAMLRQLGIKPTDF